MDNIKIYICDIGKKLYEKEFISDMEGSVSVRVGDKVYITPNRSSKVLLKSESIITLNMQSDVIDGKREPSIRTSLHMKMYNHNSAIKSIIYSNPIVASQFASDTFSRGSFDVPSTNVQITQLPEPPYKDSDVDEIIKKYIQMDIGALLSANGLLAWSDDIKRSYGIVEQVEFYSKEIVSALRSFTY